MNRMATSWKLGNLKIKNRLVRSATVEGLSTEQGARIQKLINITAALAQGGVGLIIAGTAHISHDARADLKTTGLHSDDLIEPLSRLCDAVHNAGGILAAQLLHCGSTINPAILKEKEALYGPSAMIDPLCGEPVVALTTDQIAKIVNTYAEAAARAKRSGFDAVQIHAAHGYLINQFLSPSRNQRNEKKPISLAALAQNTNSYFWYRKKVSEGTKGPLVYELTRRRVTLSLKGLLPRSE